MEVDVLSIGGSNLNAFAGMVGLPAPGLDVKLTPVDSKMEARVRGPNVTPGYWKDDALTSAAFGAGIMAWFPVRRA